MHMDFLSDFVAEPSEDEQIVDLRARMLKEMPSKIYSRSNTPIVFLYLENNEITELPEDFFPNLRHLQWLDMRNNLLRSIPSTIAHHEVLETLLLKNNKLESLPLELGTVARLRGLQLQGNPLRFPGEAVVRAGAAAVLLFLRDEAAARAARGPVLALPPPPQSTQSPSPLPARRVHTAAATGTAGAATARPAEGARPRPGPSAPPRERRVALLPDPPTQEYFNENVVRRTGYQVDFVRTTETKSPAVPLQAQMAMTSLFSRRRRTKIIEKILKDLWMEKVKQKLMKQEKEVERKKSEMALNVWRQNFKRPETFLTNYEFSAPYGYEMDGCVSAELETLRRRLEKEDIENLAATLNDNMTAIEGSPEQQHFAFARRVDVLTELQKRLQALRLKSSHENAYFTRNNLKNV